MENWHPLPAGVYSFVERTPATLLLESASSRDPSSPSRLFIDPIQILTPDCAEACHELLRQIEEAVHQGLYAAGFLTYEFGHVLEPAAGMRAPVPGRPLAWFGIYDRCYTFDHRSGKFVDGSPPTLDSLAAPAEVAEDASVAVLQKLTEEEYSHQIEAIQNYIRSGDVYQLNFTFPLRFATAVPPATLYAQLRARQPVEYAALVHWEEGRHILSFSPELFFRIEQEGDVHRIVTRPMKGTGRRGRTTSEDEEMAEWLRADAKNRSENVMIVDLLRNDLGRICHFGSIEVEDLFSVKCYPTLLQMTSTVSGVIRPQTSIREILHALFPCGSVTGAPKVRAMQLIGRLEEEPRGVYTGAIGYFSRERSVFNVAIRTLEMAGTEARMGIGSGIVIDSDAAEEHRECQLKSRFLTRRSVRFALVETLLWNGQFPFLEHHLDRLEDSARYFDFRCDRPAVRDQLLASACGFPDRRLRKVRLLLNPDGNASLTFEVLPGISGGMLRVCISRERIDAGDPMYFHKTTHRPLYADLLRRAQCAGFDDVLFLNSEGQITESALGNIFVERNGCWSTPPMSCGLLPGIYRRHLLETRRDIEQRALFPDDLKAADSVYLTNAVRGLRPIAIDWEFRADRLGMDTDPPGR